MLSRTRTRGAGTRRPNATGTMTITAVPTSEGPSVSRGSSNAAGAPTPLPEEPAIVGTLLLHGASNETRGVRWVEETIDNEHLGRKKSKICCIYSKPHDPDGHSSDSSSTSTSSSSSSSSGGPSTSPSRRSRRIRKGRSPARTAEGAAGLAGNAYERQPTVKRKSKKLPKDKKHHCGHHHSASNDDASDSPTHSHDDRANTEDN